MSLVLKFYLRHIVAGTHTLPIYLQICAGARVGGRSAAGRRDPVPDGSPALQSDALCGGPAPQQRCGFPRLQQDGAHLE